MQQYVPIDDIGAITIPAAFLEEVGIAADTPFWVILDESAIVMRLDPHGYRDCDMEQCVLRADNKLELPLFTLPRLELNAHRELLLTLSYYRDEIVIETLAAIFTDDPGKNLQAKYMKRAQTT